MDVPLWRGGVMGPVVVGLTVNGAQIVHGERMLLGVGMRR